MVLALLVIVPIRQSAPQDAPLVQETAKQTADRRAEAAARKASEAVDAATKKATQATIEIESAKANAELAKNDANKATKALTDKDAADAANAAEQHSEWAQKFAAGLATNAASSPSEISTVFSFFPSILVMLIAVMVLIIIPVGLYKASFLDKISNQAIARGLVTFLFALSTVIIALIIVVSSFMGTSSDLSQRFQQGKEVLTIFIGVFGTIIGFYFGQARDATGQAIKIVAPTLLAGVANTPYLPTAIHATGGTPPLRWSIAPTLPAGLALGAGTGVISGTPTIVSPKGKYTVTVTDSATPPASATAEITLEVKNA